ncbi:hypothetical protein N9H39_03610 [Gammaproteobacteria bacterium]|jgi:hypothetical protein|nr:hypothetical protein [Gammaproteobacteria bacterium]
MNNRTAVDRRSGQDRRVAHDLFYFDRGGGLERRAQSDRRKLEERRESWVRITSWSSVKADWPTPENLDFDLPHTLLKSILK